MDSVELANKIRIHAIKMVNHAHASHIGAILSITDVVAVLYADILKIDPKEPEAPGRDRLVMSKGHGGVSVYAALAECGFFPVEKLLSYGDNGGIFSCHVSHRHVPGVELSTGSLGHGICVACGMAMDARLKKRRHKIYALMGDGECNEGSVWETAMLAAQYRLDNFTVIIDRNDMQAMGFCRDIIDMEPMAEKWKAFGWHVVEVADGSNHSSLRDAFGEDSDGKPKVIISKTVKGRGVSFMENQLSWHYRDPQGEDFVNALKELGDYKS